jgi:hypothetical protein
VGQHICSGSGIDQFVRYLFKKPGYLELTNDEHLHDLGKFILLFLFSGPTCGFRSTC